MSKLPTIVTALTIAATASAGPIYYAGDDDKACAREVAGALRALGLEPGVEGIGVTLELMGTQHVIRSYTLADGPDVMRCSVITPLRIVAPLDDVRAYIFGLNTAYPDKFLLTRMNGVWLLIVEAQYGYEDTTDTDAVVGLMARASVMAETAINDGRRYFVEGIRVGDDDPRF